MMLAIPFGLGRLQPNLIANAHEFAQRLDVDGGFAQQDLQVASAHVVNAVSSLKKPLDDVLAHAAHLRKGSMA